MLLGGNAFAALVAGELTVRRLFTADHQLVKSLRRASSCPAGSFSSLDGDLGSEPLLDDGDDHAGVDGAALGRGERDLHLAAPARPESSPVAVHIA